jgi:type VI protein secretion system component VasF
MTEPPENGEGEEPAGEAEEGLPTGGEELAYAIADLLRAKRSKDAIATLIEKYAAEIPANNKRRFRAAMWSYAFTLVVIAVVGTLGWLHVISAESASTLIGTVIGAIFWNQRAR